MSEPEIHLNERAVRLTMERRTELMGYVYSMVRDHALAEDIFQEILIVVLKKGSDLPAEEAWGRWTREIARRTVLSALKERKRSPGIMDPEVLDAMESSWSGADGAWNSEARSTLERCMGTLSEKARRMIRERYENGLTGQKLSERLGLTLNSAYATLTRIHGALKDCMDRKLSGRTQKA